VRRPDQLGWWVLLALTGGAVSAQSTTGFSLAPVVTQIETSQKEVASIAAAIILLLSALLAIALVIMLYLKAGGGK
jgi:ABC-type Na+ efflux pump permease subunit